MLDSQACTYKASTTHNTYIVVALHKSQSLWEPHLAPAQALSTNENCKRESHWELGMGIDVLTRFVVFIAQAVNKIYLTIV